MTGSLPWRRGPRTRHVSPERTARPANWLPAGNLDGVKGPLLRLSALDSDAASAVRVISFFDVLVAQHAGLERLVASTAQLAECPAGLSVPETGVWLRADAAGVSLAEAPPPAASRELDGGGRAWLERAGEPLPLDRAGAVRDRGGRAAERDAVPVVRPG
jgi:hypothetical protein